MTIVFEEQVFKEKEEQVDIAVEQEEEEGCCEEQQELIKKPRIQWIPLESNPDVLNSIIHENGVDPNWSFIDVLGFDEESLSSLPKSIAAMIFLFPDSDNYKAYREKEEAHLKIHEQNISPNIMHFKQTISNACGMMALLHCLAHNNHLLSSGVFSKIVQDTKDMSPSERGEYLESCEELAKIHDEAAHHGQSKVPAAGDDVRDHFIAFVEVDDHLYELDGDFCLPINHGKCTDFLQDTVKIMRQAIERDPEEKEYSAIAFAKTSA